MIRFMIGLLFAVSVNSVLASGCPGDEMANGWCWSTGTSDIGDYLGWHDFNSNFPGKVHLAMDIDADEGSAVYAIADGAVIIARNDVGYYGGSYDCTLTSSKSIDGGGVVIRHRTSAGEEFDALYAHLKNINVGDSVTAGEKIAEIRNYTACGSRMDHLHFGIISPSDGSSNHWAGYGSSDLGFIDPMIFLSSHSPAPTTQTICSAPTCEIDSQTFSDGTMVGWHPKGHCDQAEQWFSIGDVNGELQPIISLEPGEVCICR